MNIFGDTIRAELVLWRVTSAFPARRADWLIPHLRRFLSALLFQTAKTGREPLEVLCWFLSIVVYIIRKALTDEYIRGYNQGRISFMESNVRRVCASARFFSTAVWFLSRVLYLSAHSQFTRNCTPQNGIISLFSALSSMGALPGFFVCLENEEIFSVWALRVRRHKICAG